MKNNILLVITFIIILFIPSIKVNADATYKIYIDYRSDQENEQYDVSPLTTVLELKNDIKDSTNIPVSRQTLKYSDTTLDDDKTMADYNIPADATITVIPLWELTYDSKITGTNSDKTTVFINGRELATPLEAPIRSGYTFGGWYEENNNGLRFDFNNVRINENKSR